MAGALVVIRQTVAAAIKAHGTAGWLESPWPYPLFPGPEPRQILDRGFAVGLLDTRLETKDKQVLAVGTLATTTVGVRFSRLITGEDQLAEYDAALEAELDLVAAILADRDLAASLRLDSVITREIVADGTVYLGELRFSCRHRYALTTE